MITTDIYTFSINSDGNHCLEHHGVKGQKWGVLDRSVYVPVGPRSRPNTYGSLGPKPRTNSYSSLGPKPRTRSQKEVNKQRTDDGRKWLISLGLGLGIAGTAYALYKGGSALAQRSDVARRYLSRARVMDYNKKIARGSNYISKQAYKDYRKRRQKESMKYLKYLLTGKY